MSYGSRVIGPNIKWPHGGAIPGLSELDNLRQRFIVGIQGVCVQSFAAIGPVVPEITRSQTD